MDDGGNSRRSLLKAGVASVALTSVPGCSGVFQDRSFAVRYEQASAPGVIVTDAPESDGPLLYATTITTRDEMEKRLDWNAAYHADTVSSIEDSDFAGMTFESHFLVILVSTFKLQRIYDTGEVLPVEFRDNTCVFPITLESLPPLSPTDEDGDPEYYFTHVAAWSRAGKPAPELAEVELRLTSTPQ